MSRIKGMTLEEAIKNREDCLKYLEGIGRKASPECMEAVRWSVKALKAIHPVSRERVEKGWRSEWNDINPTVLNPGVSWVCRCAKCGCPQDYKHKFCPNCGDAKTDEAVQMVMERLEALKDGSTTD